MALTDLSLLVLYATAIVFAIIELGLSAYAVDVTDDRWIGSDRYAYALFCSLWTLLLAGFLLVFPFLAQRRGNNIQSANKERWMAPLTLALNAVTMIFWLACFAAIADLYAGSVIREVPAAALAFAVMEWLIFLALLVLNILTAMGVIKSDRLGFSRLTNRKAITDVRPNCSKQERMVSS